MVILKKVDWFIFSLIVFQTILIVVGSELLIHRFEALHNTTTNGGWGNFAAAFYSVSVVIQYYVLSKAMKDEL